VDARPAVRPECWSNLQLALTEACGETVREMNRPTVYLDSSTLADGFDAVHVRREEAGSAYEKLYVLIGRIAAEGAPCCSLNHIEEPVAWDPYESAIERATWLDNLNPVWIKSAERALDGELEWWLRKELGLSPGSRYEPFSIALTGVIGAAITPSQTVGLLGGPGIAGIVKALHGRREQLPDVKGESLTGFQRLHQDRARLPPDADFEKVAQVIRGKRARDLEVRARELLPKLRETDQSLSEEVIRRAAGGIFEAPGAVPLDQLVNHVIEHMIRTLTAQKRNFANFRRRHASAWHDIMHLTGAVYCDVFTCDKRIDDAIGTIRTDRGMLPQLSVVRSGGPGPFVDRLQKQFETLCKLEQAGAR
jgi:hypothetical protein